MQLPNWFPKQPHYFTLLPVWYEIFNFSNPRQYLLSSIFFIIVILVNVSQWEVVSHCGFDLLHGVSLNKNSFFPVWLAWIWGFCQKAGKIQLYFKLSFNFVFRTVTVLVYTFLVNAINYLARKSLRKYQKNSAGSRWTLKRMMISTWLKLRQGRWMVT